MNKRPNKITKRELRKSIHLTRPPRLEGRAKNAGSKPIRKKKGLRRTSKAKRV